MCWVDPRQDPEALIFALQIPLLPPGPSPTCQGIAGKSLQVPLPRLGGGGEVVGAGGGKHGGGAGAPCCWSLPRCSILL